VRNLSFEIFAFCLAGCLLAGEAFPQQQTQFESLLASAQQAQARGEFESAAEFYRLAVSFHPEIPELRTNLGLMYYQTGKDELACEAFRQAVRLEPNLFVPNLFLGLDYVKQRRFREAIAYLKRAAVAKPNDVQTQLGLGQAYAGNGETRLATASYLRATQLDSGSADAWYHLGVSYLELVEADARLLLERHNSSGYLQALMAESFAEQRALIQADEAYKKTLALPNSPPGAHAGYGFVLLSRHDLSGAERELSAELTAHPGSLMAKLGMARLHVEKGDSRQAAKEIADIWNTDAGFLRVNASLLKAGLPPPKRMELKRALEEQQASGGIPEESAALFSDSATSLPTNNGIDVNPTHGPKAPVGDPDKLYAGGSYGACSDALASRLSHLLVKDLRLLVTCSYMTGNYPNALKAATKLASNPVSEAEGLYWETKTAQKLATEALARASATDSDSPKLHLLLGDLYRQWKNFPDAEKEYRRALALRPGDTGALFGLSLTLLADGENEEALNVAQAALQTNSDDPELNAVMGEILCARNDFSGAEPYLKKSLSAKPEFVSHVHALLGKVYAQTDRTQQAIAELKLALVGDKDGTVHYQIARLYLKVGDHDSAKEAFAVSEQMRRQGLARAAVALQQGAGDSE
jgi:tetratricopeptide (TPR) repeat protein